MTRQFNNTRSSSHTRNGDQPPFHKHGAERFPRPARPRLSRESVDRAWENGAQTQHADYRSRSNGPAAPSSNGRHNTQKSGYSSSQNSTGGNHYGHRNNFRDDTPDQPRGNYQRNESQRGSFSRPSGSPNQSRNYGGPRSQGNPAQDQHDRRSTPRQGYPAQDQHDRRSTPRQGYPAQDQHDRRSTPRNEGYDRQRPRGDAQQHSTQPREESDRKPVPYHRGRPPYAAQFEGDYERFAYDEPVEVADDESHSSVHKAERNRRPYQRKSYQVGHEKHVTRLPDGRVLKGSRPEQRKKAQFWREITQDTAGLVEQVQPASATSAQPTDEKSQDQAEVEQPSTAKTPRTNRPVAATKTDSTAKSKKAETTANKPRSRGPKPSQRGFKWPANN